MQPTTPEPARIESAEVATRARLAREQQFRDRAARRTWRARTALIGGAAAASLALGSVLVVQSTAATAAGTNGSSGSTSSSTAGGSQSTGSLTSAGSTSSASHATSSGS